MQTQYLLINSIADRELIKKAAHILKDGGLLALPTETVYGLAANALDKEVVSNIFKAKGRPEDNPLIVHICKVDSLYKLVEDVDERVLSLAKAFWPGPLTLVLKKKNIVPDNVSGGLNTVAVRMPDHPVALAIIEEAGFPLAAPSANASGSPSPTCALHVAHDLDGKVNAIVDSGDCEVGVESTVLSLTNEKPIILRPGAVTQDRLEAVIGSVDFAAAIYESLDENTVPQSPGMKYRHYAPQVSLSLVRGSKEGFSEYLNTLDSLEGIGALCFDGEEDLMPVATVTYGRQGDYKQQAKRLFSALRELDDLAGVRKAFVRAPEPYGLGLAVYNRLLRAASFDVIDTK